MRFSLTTLLLATGAIAVVCGIFFALPGVIAVWVLMAFSGATLPALLVSGVVFGAGYTRAFFIGCLASIGWTIPFLPFSMMVGGPFALGAVDGEGAAAVKIMFATLYATVLLGGAAAMFVRWFCVRNSSVPASNPHSAASTVPLEYQMTPHDRAELYAIFQGRLSGQESGGGGHESGGRHRVAKSANAPPMS